MMHAARVQPKDADARGRYDFVRTDRSKPTRGKGSSPQKDDAQKFLETVYDNHVKKNRNRRNLTSTLRTRIKKIHDLISIALSEEYQHDDWDGYGAKKINNDSVVMAWRFLKSLANDVALPEPEPNPNGLLGLYWEKETCQLLLDITPEGKISYAYRASTGAYSTGRMSFNSAVPQSLHDLLIKHFKK